MKGFRQSRMLKAVAVVLLFFSIAAIPLSVIGEAYLAQEIFDGNVEEMFQGDFEDSERFSRLFSTRIGQLAEYMKLKDILETDGALDYNKPVCHVVDDGLFNFEPQGYTIGELIKSNSFFVEDIDSQNTTLLEELFSMYPQRQWYVYTDDNGEAALGYVETAEFIKDFNSDIDWFFIEDYEKAIELWEETTERQEKKNLQDGKLSGDELEVAAYASAVDVESVSVQEQQAQNKLPEGACWIFTQDELAYRYTYYVAYYLHYHQLFEDNGEHRFVYSLNTGDTVYTNAAGLIENCQAGKEPVDGTLYYGNTSYAVETDISNVNRSYVDNLEKAVMNSHDKFEFFAAVTDWSTTPDTEDDAFTIKESFYNRAQGMCQALLVIGVIGIFGVLILGLYLIASAGHAKDVEGVRLTWFDRWYTEPAAVICILVLTCAVAAEITLIEGFSWSQELFYIVLAAGGALVCYLAGIFSIASLLRRIKAGTLWKNSLLLNGGRWLLRGAGKFSRGCRVVYEERDITARTIIAYIMILAATVVTGILIMVTLFEGSMLVLFFLLLFAGIHAGGLYVLLRDRVDYKRIIEGVERMADGDLNYKVDEEGMQLDNKRLAVATNRVGNGLAAAVEKSIKDERMKTDLITNVSHDIKTPLTSIINYVDLLKREKIEDEKIRSYIDVLDSKSQRLKNLTDDLVEASKLSSGNIVLTMQEINLVELVNQANGEFTEKFASKNLTIIPTLPANPVMIEADGRRLWRVLENLYNNVSKYAMENTRVYVTVVPENGRGSFVIKNISANALNINADELTERFIRGDVSRSTEGSGLGLSIAKSLTELMNGSFEIYLDGDLFRVTVTFPVK